MNKIKVDIVPTINCGYQILDKIQYKFGWLAIAKNIYTESYVIWNYYPDKKEFETGRYYSNATDCYKKLNQLLQDSL